MMGAATENRKTSFQAPISEHLRDRFSVPKNVPAPMNDLKIEPEKTVPDTNHDTHDDIMYPSSIASRLFRGNLVRQHLASHRNLSRFACRSTYCF
jgi:hypothetical protein